MGTYYARVTLLNKADQAPGLGELNIAVRRAKQENGYYQISAVVREGLMSSSRVGN